MQLYEHDAFCRKFTSVVLSCTAKGDTLYEVVLQETAFYPEGGGQPWDMGTLNDVPVVEVHKKEGIILHCCTSPLDVGATVTGEIDWERRFDLMQQHSGEHIVSGFAHSMFGCENVGFHMGKDKITIDFDVFLSQEQLTQLQERANLYFWENHPISITYPSPEQLKSIEYRSKKELSGEVRIVSFDGADCCACCGTHVHTSGQVGLVVFISSQKFREGIRIELLCGKRALDYLNQIQEQNTIISQTLCAKPLNTSEYVTKLVEEKEKSQIQKANLEKKYITFLVDSYKHQPHACVFVEDVSSDALRILAVDLSQEIEGIALCYTNEEKSEKSNMLRYALASQNMDVTPLSYVLKERLSARGGGKPNLVQGSLPIVSTETMEEVFTKFLEQQ